MRAAGERISTLQFEINDITMMIGADISFRADIKLIFSNPSVATCGVFFNIFLFFTLHGGLPTCHLSHGEFCLPDTFQFFPDHEAEQMLLLSRSYRRRR